MRHWLQMTSFPTRRSFLGCALGLALRPPLRATAQQADWIQIEGKDYALLTNPLRPYLDAHPDALPEPNVISTSLWRGYVATWEVQDQQLFLSAVEMPQWEKEPRNVISEVFSGREKVVAEWYTGYLIVPTGKLVHYTHMGYASLYKRYIRLRIRAGVIEEQTRLTKRDYAKFMRVQFAAFKETPEGKGMIRKFDEEFVFQVAAATYTSTIYEGLTTEP